MHLQFECLIQVMKDFTTSLEAQVMVSGSRLNPLKPSYGVEFVSAKIQSDDAAFFSATNLECHTSWGKLLGESLTVESVQIKELAFLQKALYG